MTPLAESDPVLRRVRAALDAMYGDRLERVVLFGSRARGDARPDSDYDVAVFLRDLSDPWPEHRRLADLRVELLQSAGVFLEAQPFPEGTLARRTPLMHEIRRDGREL